MKNYSVFDILGPVMIGPSSSHTAGAARLGKVAMSIAGKDFTSVTFYLHGSFAKTYRGHGTDRALVAGILGLNADDSRLRNSIEMASQRNIKINFVETDLGDEHPNTVKIVFKKKDGTEVEVTGSSIGGGNIIITKINEDNVEFTGTLPTLIVKHVDTKGMVSKITSELAKNEINIATMKVNRKGKGKEALTVIECDNVISSEVVEKLSKLEQVLSARFINPV
ncbi:L-serine ammonia-lyase, iron-sulfur-dependent subunit beta [Fonticella tunisiensis]|uniref:L-serine deaminase n=1 Tax=Fonticella tunisiensis TaxID=1096341 RepID=A0A4R7KQP7_9CLOT|nr:L-serine ammonia-lyase, iron-sulfur-dependent subunit beta [Fonticella tunisiensis]TDT60893.1 L-serine dehydratase [Fonticella tunisiensis]